MNEDCSTCICKEGSCYPSNTIFDKDKTCKSYSPDYEGYIADLEKKNAELQHKVDTLQGFLDRDVEFDNLQKENTELKSRDCWKGCLYASGKSELIHEFLQQKYNLTKAKELLAKWVELFKPKGGNIPPTPIQVDTEQFLKE